MRVRKFLSEQRKPRNQFKSADFYGFSYNGAMPIQLEIPTEIDLNAFVSQEAHDLKSPFNRIMGFIKLVLKGMDGPISDQAKEDLTTAYQNSQYALALMSGLVEMARLSRRERAISPGECIMDAQVRQVVTDWQRQSHRDHPVEITWTSPACTLQADGSSLRTCLSNWISYVAEFVQQNVAVNIQVEEHQHACLVSLRSTGQKTRPAAECDTTVYGYVASQLLALNRGELLNAEEDEQGVLVQFSLVKS
jgi:K+-sensing histidine kinase KdpD